MKSCKSKGLAGGTVVVAGADESLEELCEVFAGSEVRAARKMAKQQSTVGQ